MAISHSEFKNDSVSLGTMKAWIRRGFAELKLCLELEIKNPQFVSIWRVNMVMSVMSPLVRFGI